MDWRRAGTPASCHTGQTRTDEPQCPAARPSETSRTWAQVCPAGRSLQPQSDSQKTVNGESQGLAQVENLRTQSDLLSWTGN